MSGKNRVRPYYSKKDGDNVYEQQKRELRQHGAYYNIHRDWNPVVGPLLAAVIGGLLNIAALMRPDEFLEENNRVYFWCARQRICNEFGFSDKQEKLAIKKLCELGIVHRKMIGIPAKRYLCLDLKKLNKLIDEFFAK